ncbi:LPS assembly protein LptD, partial [Salmonella enterica subsp. enterica serovar Infantis]
NPGALVGAGDPSWRISDRWGVRSGVQFATRLDSVATSSSSLDYRRDQDRLVQLNYRDASPDYIQATVPSYYSTAEQDN